MATIYTNDILKVEQQVVDDTYIFRFLWDTWNKSDLELIGKFGDPLINIGGSFGPEGDLNAFTLADEYIRLKAGFPYVKTFSVEDPMFAATGSAWADGYTGPYFKVNARANTGSTDYSGPVTITSPGTSSYVTAPNVVILQSLFSESNLGINTSNYTITVPDNTLAVDSPVYFTAGADAELPTGLQENKAYFVKTVSGNDITLKATIGSGTGTDTVVISSSGTPTWTMHGGKLFGFGTANLSAGDVVSVVFDSGYTNTTDQLTTADELLVMVDALDCGEALGTQATFVYNTCIPAIADIEAYAGASDATYILSVVRAGPWYTGNNAATCGKLRISTVESIDGNYIDVLPKTSSANVYYNIGTLGLTAKMAAVDNGANLTFPTGLFAGDTWYVPVQPGSNGRIKIQYFRDGIFARVDAALKLLRTEAAKDVTGNFSHNVNYTV
jgi:hypothetical protein